MPHTVRKGKKDRIWIRKRFEQSNNLLEKTLQHLSEVREVFKEQGYEEYSERMDAIGQSLILVETAIEEFRKSI